MSRAYAPVVHLTALATFLGWVFIAGTAWQPALLNAIAVLIITCPCALALAVPVVQVIASGRLMRQGILLKSATALERDRDRPFVFDKTGTLTLGRPELVDGDHDAETLKAAAALAASTRHPLAQALVRAAGSAVPAEGVVEHPGQGLQAGGARLGSATFCCVANAGDDGLPELWFTAPGRLPTRFAFAERLRPDAAAAIAHLQRRGLTVELLSGDRPAAVARAAIDAGIGRWQAEVSPAGKAARLAALAVEGRRVLMVGDGLNDARLSPPRTPRSRRRLPPKRRRTPPTRCSRAMRLQPVARPSTSRGGPTGWCARTSRCARLQSQRRAARHPGRGHAAGRGGGDVLVLAAGDRQRARLERWAADGQPAHPCPGRLGVRPVALAAFLWALRNGQYDDPEGAAGRILFDDD